jgi:hypothetical protein
VESLGAGGGAGVAATVSGDEARLGQAVGRRVAAGRSQHKAGERRGRGWDGTWMSVERRWGGRGGAHGQPKQRRRTAEKQRRGGER